MPQKAALISLGLVCHLDMESLL